LEDNNLKNKRGEVCIEVQGLWKIFGKKADEILNSEWVNQTTRLESETFTFVFRKSQNLPDRSIRVSGIHKP
jgi:hypothetical protein